MLVAKEARMGRFDNMTALMTAAAKGHMEPVQLLIPYEIGMQDDDGDFALLYASRGNHPEICMALLEKEAGL